MCLFAKTGIWKKVTKITEYVSKLWKETIDAKSEKSCEEICFTIFYENTEYMLSVKIGKSYN